MEFKIGHKTIGDGHPVFIVAEISANHRQDFNLAVEMIYKAKECGADAVKFQTYTPDTMTLNVNNAYFQIDHPQWGGQTLYKLYEKAYTPWDWFLKLKAVCDECEIVFFSTAFDSTSVDFLENLNVSVHKIASFELTDIPLIEYMAQTRKPLIMSTGMANDEEIDEAVSAARHAGAKDIMLLKCVSSYPASPKEMNLRTLERFRERYKCCVGFSDHTLGVTVSIAAMTLGASFIEKHFILDKSIKTPDSFFSIDPTELKSLVQSVRMIEESLGTIENRSNGQEEKSKNFRRSLFVVEDMEKGDEFTLNNVRAIRPGMGLKPKYLHGIIGQTASQSIAKGTPLNWKLVR